MSDLLRFCNFSSGAFPELSSLALYTGRPVLFLALPFAKLENVQITYIFGCLQSHELVWLCQLPCVVSNPSTVSGTRRVLSYTSFLRKSF